MQEISYLNVQRQAHLSYFYNKICYTYAHVSPKILCFGYLEKLLWASSEFFLNEIFSLVALFQIRTEAGVQRGCSPASPQAQDILKPKGRQKA